MYPFFLFHVFFNPGPCLHTPGTRVWAGWGDLGDSRARSGTHSQHFALSLSDKSSRKGRQPHEKSPRFDLTSRPCGVLLSWPSWVLNPTVYPLYPGASADYSSPPCCVSVCIGRKNGKRAANSQASPVSSAPDPAARSAPCWPGRSSHTDTAEG